MVGQGQAAFFPRRQFRAFGDDLGVDHRDRLPLVLAGYVDDDDAQADIDLRRGEADSGRLVHRGEHARDQVAHRVVVGVGHGAGLGFQGGVGRDQDRQQADRLAGC